MIAPAAVPARNPNPKGLNMNREGCLIFLISAVSFLSAVVCLILLYI